MQLRKMCLAAIGVGMALTMNSFAAFAQEEEAPDNDGYFMQDVLGWIGIVPESKPTIDYRERPTLVVPPKGGAKLPPPIDRTKMNARAKNWPNDPDAARARDAGVPFTETEAYKMQKNGRLSPEQLQAVRRSGSAPQGPLGAVPEGSRAANYVDPDFLRNNGKAPEEQVLPGQEPRRKFLTDPPTGLRKPSTPGKVVAPAPQQTVDPSSPRAFFTRNDD